MLARAAIALVTAAVTAAAAWGQASAIPQLSSRPGAGYTLYLNFAGFNYSGTWYGATPGVTPAYTVDSDPNFSVAELTHIRTVWSRAAEKYSAFDVNVTTTDPAAAGLTDAQRQAFYDNQPRMMHTVVGGTGTWWDTGITGVSGSSVASGVATGGRHTNWVFSANYVQGGVVSLPGVGETVAHENGHALRLRHQSLWNGTTLVDEYDPGTAARAPVMGYSETAARGLWRVGTTSQSATSIQNDPAVLLTNPGITGTGAGGFVDSGIGHTRLTATPLPLVSTAIDHTAARGVITPNSATPTPLGEENYTKDYFTFTSTSPANLNVTLRSGRSTLTPGLADPGATLDATLRLLAADGGVLAQSNSGTFTEAIARSDLPAGTYYLEIASAGADAAYFDMGSYFLTGTLTPVPEPTVVLGVAGLVLGGVSWTRRRRA
jgi:hypothetical protein